MRVQQGRRRIPLSSSLYHHSRGKRFFSCMIFFFSFFFFFYHGRLKRDAGEPLVIVTFARHVSILIYIFESSSSKYGNIILYIQSTTH